MNAERLQELLHNLPVSPGVYLMKNLSGRVVYVGKASNLRQRVKQYFAQSTSDTRYFVKGLAARLSTIETVVTNTEKEALLLEYNLVQLHLPRYNIRLMDDKDFLCVRLDTTVPWPRIEIVRKPHKDKALYFGPYPSATQARETVRLINRYFKLRNCKDTYFANRARPCLQYQIKRCLAPCVLPVEQAEYAAQVEYVKLFLEGRKDDLLRELRKKMITAAETFDFESAAILRDQVHAIEETLSPQRITEISNTDRDVVGLFRDGDLVQIVVMEFLAGRLSGMLEFFFKDQEFPDEEILSSFLLQRYNQAVRYPDEILLSRELWDVQALGEVFSEGRGQKVRVYTPKRGRRVEQVALADKNAKHVFEKSRRQKENLEERLRAIQEVLKLPGLPHRIECVDIAHLQGTNTVGAISAVSDGKVNRAMGRIFRIRGAGGGDDYEAISEVLTRRFLRAKASDKGWDRPDLLVIDGGKGQLGIAIAVLKELDLSDQPVVGLAKERLHQKSAESDRVYLPGRANPISVRAETSPLYLLSAARDEAHRLANTFQSRSGRKRSLVSELDNIEGVGPKIRALLLAHVGSVKRIKEATFDDLIAVKGVGPQMARRIVDAFSNEKATVTTGPECRE